MFVDAGTFDRIWGALIYFYIIKYMSTDFRNYCNFSLIIKQLIIAVDFPRVLRMDMGAGVKRKM